MIDDFPTPVSPRKMTLAYENDPLASLLIPQISTNNYELYDLMKMKRSHGLARESTRYAEYVKQYPDISNQFLFITDGYNFRNHEICAVLGLSQLERLDKYIQIRNRNYIKFISFFIVFISIFSILFNFLNSF